MLTLFSKKVSGCRASARRAAEGRGGFGGDQPSAMLALSSKGEYRIKTSVIPVIYGRKGRSGVHAVYSAVFRLYVLLSYVYSVSHLFGTQGI